MGQIESPNHYAHSLRTKIAARIVICLAALCAGGCGAVVHPPGAVTDPTTVYVCDYGVHSAVMLPVEQHRFVEYAFGDWGYCAYNKMLPTDAIGALVVSNESAFGRRYIEMKPGQRYPTPKVELPKRVFPVVVSQESVTAVEAKLDRRFQRAYYTHVYNAENDTVYVKDDEPYSAVNSCNELTGSILRYLGCEVDGPTFFSHFHYSSDLARDSHPLQLSPGDAMPGPDIQSASAR